MVHEWAWACVHKHRLTTHADSIHVNRRCCEVMSEMGGSVREGQIWNSLKCTAGMWARGIYQSESSVVQGTSSLQLRLPTNSVSDVFVGGHSGGAESIIFTDRSWKGDREKKKIYICVCVGMCVVRLYFNPCYTLQMFPLWPDNGATVFVCQALARFAHPSGKLAIL